MKILLYHNLEDSVLSLRRVFEQSCIHVEVCQEMDRLLYLTGVESYSAVLIYNVTPLEDLRTLYTNWRKKSKQGSFVILTNTQSSFERIKMLEMGVDCYFITPYSYSSLVTELVTLDYQREISSRGRYYTEHFEVDILSRVALCNSRLLNFTKKEFDLFSLFVRRHGRVLSRVQIWEEVWGYEDFPLANSIDVHLNRLRKKLPEDYRGLIKTVYGVGYQMNDGD